MPLGYADVCQDLIGEFPAIVNDMVSFIDLWLVQSSMLTKLFTTLAPGETDIFNVEIRELLFTRPNIIQSVDTRLSMQKIATRQLLRLLCLLVLGHNSDGGESDENTDHPQGHRSNFSLDSEVIQEITSAGLLSTHWNQLAAAQIPKALLAVSNITEWDKIPLFRTSVLGVVFLLHQDRSSGTICCNMDLVSRSYRILSDLQRATMNPSIAKKLKGCNCLMSVSFDLPEWDAHLRRVIDYADALSLQPVWDNEEEKCARPLEAVLCGSIRELLIRPFAENSVTTSMEICTAIMIENAVRSLSLKKATGSSESMGFGTDSFWGNTISVQLPTIGARTHCNGLLDAYVFCVQFLISQTISSNYAKDTTLSKCSESSYRFVFDRASSDLFTNFLSLASNCVIKSMIVATIEYSSQARRWTEFDFSASCVLTVTPTIQIAPSIISTRLITLWMMCRATSQEPSHASLMLPQHTSLHDLMQMLRRVLSQAIIGDIGKIHDEPMSTLKHALCDAGQMNVLKSAPVLCSLMGDSSCFTAEEFMKQVVDARQCWATTPWSEYPRKCMRIILSASAILPVSVQLDEDRFLCARRIFPMEWSSMKCNDGSMAFTCFNWQYAETVARERDAKSTSDVLTGYALLTFWKHSILSALTILGQDQEENEIHLTPPFERCNFLSFRFMQRLSDSTLKTHSKLHPIRIGVLVSQWLRMYGDTQGLVIWKAAQVFMNYPAFQSGVKWFPQRVQEHLDVIFRVLGDVATMSRMLQPNALSDAVFQQGIDSLDISKHMGSKIDTAESTLLVAVDMAMKINDDRVAVRTLARICAVMCADFYLWLYAFAFSELNAVDVTSWLQGLEDILDGWIDSIDVSSSPSDPIFDKLYDTLESESVHLGSTLIQEEEKQKYTDECVKGRKTAKNRVKKERARENQLLKQKRAADKKIYALLQTKSEEYERTIANALAKLRGIILVIEKLCLMRLKSTFSNNMESCNKMAADIDIRLAKQRVCCKSLMADVRVQILLSEACGALRLFETPHIHKDKAILDALSEDIICSICLTPLDMAVRLSDGSVLNQSCWELWKDTCKKSGHDITSPTTRALVNETSIPDSLLRGIVVRVVGAKRSNK